MKAGIVTGTDGSASASAAVRQAAELAAASGVPLHLVSGFPPGGSPGEAVAAHAGGGARGARRRRRRGRAARGAGRPGGVAVRRRRACRRRADRRRQQGHRRAARALPAGDRRAGPAAGAVPGARHRHRALLARGRGRRRDRAGRAPRPDPARVAGAARHDGRRLHGVPRRDDRQRRVPVDGGRLPRGVAERALLGPQRVQHRLRRGARARGPDRRPRRPAAALLRRALAVPGRLGAVRARARPGLPDRRRASCRRSARRR